MEKWKDMETIITWLVVLTPLKNMKVNGKDYPIYIYMIMEKNVPNHQPVTECQWLH